MNYSFLFVQFSLAIVHCSLGKRTTNNVQAFTILIPYGKINVLGAVFLLILFPYGESQKTLNR